jgi:hypothetical protein
MTVSNAVSRYDANEREFLGLLLSRSIFGALYSALTVRKTDLDLTRAEFGNRVGRDKTGVSKILKGPGNWTIMKISDVANALDLDIEVYFVDRYNPQRTFTSTGVMYTASKVAARGYGSVLQGPQPGRNTASIDAIGQQRNDVTIQYSGQVTTIEQGMSIISAQGTTMSPGTNIIGAVITGANVNAVASNVPFYTSLSSRGT